MSIGGLGKTILFTIIIYSDVLQKRRCAAFGHLSRHFPDIIAWRPEASRPRGRPPLRLYEMIASDKGWRAGLRVMAVSHILLTAVSPL
jgi:hypothetical protein